MKENIKIALVQMSMSKNMKENIEKVFAYIEEAANNGANLICFPELQFYRFFPQYSKLNVNSCALDIGSEVIQRIQEKCKQFNIAIVPNFYLEQNRYRYDASPFIDRNGKILGISKMVHIVQANQFFEQDYYTPSEEGFKVYDTSIGKIGIVICFDRHYPESIRSCALQNADLIIIPTANTKEEPLEMFEWELRIPANQNSVFIAMCNRVGIEDNMNFAGQSIVVNPNGKVLAKADDKEQVLYCNICMKESAENRNKKPYFALRRPDKYFK